MRKTAPWPVDWIDTSEAIARRALSLVKHLPPDDGDGGSDVAVFTSGDPPAPIRRLVGGFGFRIA